MSAAIELRFAAPTRPWSTNEDRKLHWAERAKRIKAWRKATRLAAAGCDSEFGPALVEVELGFERGGRRDPMNYVGTCVKALVDGLVDAGMWPDDTPEHVAVTQPRLVVGETTVLVRISPQSPQPE